MACVSGLVPTGSAPWCQRDSRPGGRRGIPGTVCPQRNAMVPTLLDPCRPGSRTSRNVSVMTTARAAGAAKGSASRGASRAGGGKRGKPIRTGRPGPVTSTESKEQKAKTEAPPPSHDKNVRPAGMRSRVGVRATTNGSPFADLRLGGTILSPAAHKNPEKAREERRKLWARLGANSTSQTGFAHLLENVEGEVSEDGDDKTQRGSGRGPSGTRQRGAGRATLRVGFTAHREKFAKALRLELEEEMARAEERLNTWPTDRLQREGYALFGLRGLHDGTLQKDAVVRVLIPRRGIYAPPPVAVAVDDGPLEKDTTKTFSKTNSTNPQKTGTKPGVQRQFALGAELPFHRFGQGDMVTLVEGDEWDESGKSSVTGIVVERAMHFLKIAVDEEDEGILLQAGKLRLDLSANTVSHDRALQALVAFSDASGMPGFETNQNREKQATRITSTAYAPLQRALIGIPDGDAKDLNEVKRNIASLASVPPPWATRDLGGKIKAAMQTTSARHLNDSQQLAVRRGLTRTLSIWQGPPGTGKTKALTSFIEAAVALALETTGVGVGSGVTGKQSPRGANNKSGSTKGDNNTGNTSQSSATSPVVLACAASNVAVDNIVAGLVASDSLFGPARRRLKIVRLGSPAKVSATLEQYTLTAQASQTVLGKEAAAKRLEVKGDFTSRGARTRREAFVLERAAEKWILRNADVVCSTCVGAGDDLLEGFVFRVACVDEAAQCPEPAALIPVTKALSCVLVGDAKQLPPTVTSREALGAGLGVSLFERMERLGVVPDLLNVQYRMHPSLSSFPSLAFYGGAVKSHFLPTDRPPPLGIAWPNFGKHPVIFIEVASGVEQREKDGLSISNPVEAKLAIAVTKALLRSAGGERHENENEKSQGGYVSVASAGEIGIIAPYRAQVRRVKELWAQSQTSCGGGGRNFARSTSDGHKNDSDGENGSETDLEVHSVDGFQGREKEVIVLCTTRANPGRSLGFVSDERRMNVAMTRARRGLVVLGNRSTLSSDNTWARWFVWMDKKGLVVTAEQAGL